MTTSVRPVPQSVVDLVRAWRRLADCQALRDRMARRACAMLEIPPLADDDPTRFHVQLEDHADAIVLRASVPGADVANLRVWLTPDFVLLRGVDADGDAVERLVPLPATIDAEAVEVERTEGRFALRLTKQAALPRVVWPPRSTTL